jgi:hypothetical protein
MATNQPPDFVSLVTRIISRGNSLFIEFSITIISFLVSSVTIKYLSMILNFSQSLIFSRALACVGSFVCFGVAVESVASKSANVGQYTFSGGNYTQRFVLMSVAGF